MANDTKSVDIEKETSIGAYLWKQLYQNTVAFGGMIGGAYAGLLAARPFAKNHGFSPEQVTRWESSLFSKIPGLKKLMDPKTAAIGGGIGAGIGTVVAGIILGYEHWKKIKQSQLQVDEITRDISEIEVFKKTDPELKAENERLWAELKKRDAGQGTMADKHGGHKKESWTAAASAASETPAEATR